MTPTTFDFQAIIAKPLHVSGMRNVKVLDAETVRKLVQAHHPAARQKATEPKPAFAKS